MLSTQLGICTPSAEQRLFTDWDNPAGCELWVKRDDLIHPIISGNKWRKLAANLAYAAEQNCRHLVSFGGGHSNHLHALGYVARQLGWRFTALVRGDYRHQLTPTLQDLTDWGCNIHYVTKQEYQQRTQQTYLQRLQQQLPDALIIPEGGSNQLALDGCQQIVSELQRHYDYLLLPVASGGTMAGLLSARPACQVIGVAMLKGRDYLESLVTDLLSEPQSGWHIEHEYHHGGYAKQSEQLLEFLAEPGITPSLPLEPVYSGKLFYAVRDMLANGAFRSGSRILLLHTGGVRNRTD